MACAHLRPKGPVGHRAQRLRLRRLVPPGPLGDDRDLDTVAAELNGRPRHTPLWMTPSEALDEALR